MFLLQVALIFWILAFLLDYTLRGIVHFTAALTGMLVHLIVQMFKDRHLA